MARLTLNKYVGDPSLNGFRLTLTSGTPVTTADVTGATTLYLTPYKGDNLVLWDGTNWQLYQSPEVSLAVGTLADASIYDVWVRDVNGTPTMDFSAAWTNDTTRSQATATTNGVTHKSGDQTRRLAGTIRTTATTTTEDSAAKRFVWNASNRVQRNMRVVDGTDTWAYGTAVWRSANNSTANRLQFLIGLATEPVHAAAYGMFYNSAGTGGARVGIALDATNTNHAYLMTGSAAPGANLGVTCNAFYETVVVAGYHYLQWTEYAATANTVYYGDAGVADQIQAGTHGTVWN